MRVSQKPTDIRVKEPGRVSKLNRAAEVAERVPGRQVNVPESSRQARNSYSSSSSVSPGLPMGA